ncbi:MAG: ABC transporter permease [Bacillota bacterium]
MKTLRKVFFRWEWLVIGLTVLVYIFFQARLHDSYTVVKLLDQTRVYVVDIGFMAIGTMMVLILGDIDISVGSTAALSVTVMGVAYNAGSGVSFWAAAALALLTGAACGLINGLLVVKFKELFPMIITLSTLTIYRGIAYIILKDGAAGGFPTWFSKTLGYGSVLGGVPVMLLCLLAVFPVFYVLLHHTVFGRRLYATGTNIVAARYCGIRTDRIKVAVFTMNGLLAAVGGIMLLSRTGSVKYNIAAGYEMQAIAVAVLSGASTAGGKGSVIGVLLSLCLLTCLKNGLMIAFNDSFILNLAIGVLLIGMVLLPNLYQMLRQRREVKRQQLLTLHS